MRHVLVRYGEIGTKSRYVQHQMLGVLRQRIEDRLEYEDADFEKVSKHNGRIIAEVEEAEELAPKIAEMPGVSSASPAKKVAADIEELKKASEEFEFGDTFGVDTNRTGDHDFTSKDVNEQVGAHIEGFTGASVDLDNPDTWMEFDIRGDEAYAFNERIEGPGGFPVGAQSGLMALISGGIDSPVAAYRMMTRGADITPVYFYNKPIAAEDHLMRFERTVSDLKRFHPSKDWTYYIVDMEEVNQRLMDIDHGRMVAHRIIMFRVAEKLAESDGLNGLLTGEALGQKSSQTLSNLEFTSKQVDKPVHRPLISMSKSDIVDQAKDLGTFETATINSACSSLSPSSPATRMTEKKMEEIKEKLDIDELVNIALENVTEKTF